MTQKCDFLVIGSGIAGLSYALKAAACGPVIIVTKCGPEETNTKYAQGGIAAVYSDQDDFDLHVRDTLEAGAGLCHEDVVRMVVESGPARIRELIDWGVEFTRDAQEREGYDLHLEGGHSRKRILHAADLTGAAIEKALLERVREHPNIKILDHHMAVDLIMKRKIDGDIENDRCLGAYVLNTKSGEIPAYVAKTTLLATGGMGKVYLVTSNPDIASGDGIAIAFRAGAAVANMEFMQFHPTCLFHPLARNFLITEALRGAGAVLVDKNGREFMQRYDKRGSLAPRDIVARAIDSEIKKSGSECLYLDITHKPASEVKTEFPNIYQRCLRLDIDITKALIPVAPGAHYQCGGILVDKDGKTTIPSLYAIGEVSCTGMHGANRLASNSLLEAAVYAHRAAGSSTSEDAKIIDPNLVKTWDPGHATDSDEMVVVTHNWDEIRRLMQNYVGIVRTDRRLERAKTRIDNLEREIRQYFWDFTVTQDLLELRNLAESADLVIRCAMARRESRGLHYSLDCPEAGKTDHSKDTIVTKH
jgi:L-aspartate oxidase